MADGVSIEGLLEGEYGDPFNPGFHLVSENHDGPVCRKLYITIFPRKQGSSTGERTPRRQQWRLLATIYSDRIVMRPVHLNLHAQRYLNSRHGFISTITYETNRSQALPETAEEAVEHVEYRLPNRLFNSCSEGLGLIKELDPFWKELAPIQPDTLHVVRKGGSRIDGRTVYVTEAEIDEFRRGFERVKRKTREKAREARKWMVHNDLLSKFDLARFPRMEAVTFSAPLVQVRRVGARSSIEAAREQRRSSVRVIQQSLPELAEDAPCELLQLHAEIERVTLEQMIGRFERMIEQNHNEPRWQRFFEDNVFVLSMLFSRPVQLLHTQFHAQGSALTGSGAQVGDFLFAERGQALAIVEIKKPGVEVTAGSPYRNREVYGPSAELSGAVAQVLTQQSAMRVGWLGHRDRNPELSDSRPDAIRCVVIAGMTPTDKLRQRSFEVFRNACKDVDIITFDELLGKLQLMRQHLSPPSSPEPTQECDIPF